MNAQNPPKPDEIVIEAAQTVAGLADDSKFVTLAQDSLKLFGPQMVPLVTAGDSASFFAPILLLIDGALRPCAVLLLQDRMVFAWTTGTFRVKSHTNVAPLTSVQSISEITDVEGEGQGIRGLSFEVVTDHKWKLVFYNIGNSRGVANMLHGLLSSGSAA
jgi:hypothetical protein